MEETEALTVLKYVLYVLRFDSFSMFNLLKVVL
ncbi:hypothetical protein Goshw_006122, partial [Gossypium schwendimanii]|nr:hypothetical protein [Gossypium schwendimanii]